jgi:hypothetical protein
MTHYSTENTTKTCNFPAISLREYRAALVAEIAQLDHSSSGYRLYGEHQDIDDCACWWMAARETSPFAGGF